MRYQIFLLFTAAFLASIFSTFSNASSCANANVELQVLGSGGPELDDNRNSSSYLIWVAGKARLLVDAGPGSSVAFGNANAKFTDLKGILLTHLHVDHSADMPAFIKGSFFTDRKTNLMVFGPSGNALMPSTSDFIQRLMSAEGAFAYLDDYVVPTISNDYHVLAKDVPLTIGEVYSYSLGDISVKASPVHHGPVAAVAWRVDIGECAIAFSGDMSNQYNTFKNLASNVDILVAHNAIPQELKGVGRKLHMPASEIGMIAKNAKIKTLVLSHFMNRTAAIQAETIDIIRQKYTGEIVLAEDGMRID